MTDQTVDIEVELQTRQSVAAAKAVADELTRVVNNVAALEGKLRQVFTGTLPKELEKYASYIQTISAAPANMGSVNRAARNLSSGGPAAQLQRATVQGVVANLRTDPAVQALAVEKEINKVAEARLKLYERIRERMPETDDLRHAQAAYTELMRELSGVTSDRRTKEFKDFAAKTRTETVNFEDQLHVRRLAADQDRIRREQAELERLRQLSERADAEKLNREYDRRRRLEEREQQRRRDAAIKEVEDLEKARARHEYGDAAAMNRDYDRRQRQAQANSPEAREERTRASLQGISDRFSYQGGAGMFMTQGRIMANFAAWGGLLATMSALSVGVRDFETAMANLAGISAATDLEMKVLNQTVLDLGTNTKFSTVELANGATVLAQAGYSAQQIGKMLEPIAQMAAGTGVAFEQAAQSVTSVMTIYNMSVDQTAQVTNLLTASLNKSKLDMNQLGLGIQYAGNMAKEGGVQLNELTAALGAMSNAGIKGSTAGTGLRAVLTTLEAPTDKFKKQLASVHLTMADVDLRTNGLRGALENMKNAGFGATEAMKGMDVRAAAAYVAMTNNLDAMQEMETSVVGTTAAMDANAKQMDTLQARWQQFVNTGVAAASTAGGPVLTALKGLLQVMAGLMQGASAAAPALAAVGTILAAMVSAQALLFISGLTKGLLETRVAAIAAAAGLDATTAAELRAGLAAKGLIGTMRALAGAFLATPFGALTVGITAVVGAFAAMNYMAEQQNRRIDELTTTFNDAQAEAGSYKSRIQQVDDEISTLIARHERLSAGTKQAGEEARAAAETANNKFAAWGFTIQGVGSNVDTLIGKLRVLRAEQASALAGAMQTQLVTSQNLARENDAKLDRQEVEIRGRTRALPNQYRDLGRDVERALASNDPNRIAAALNKVRSAADKAPGMTLNGVGPRAQLNDLTKQLTDALGTSNAALQARTQSRQIQTELPSVQAQSSREYTTASARVGEAVNNMNRRATEAQRVGATDPNKAINMGMQASRDADAQLKALESSVSPTVLAELKKDPNYRRLAVQAGRSEFVGSQATAEAQAKEFDAYSALAKKRGDLTAAEEYKRKAEGMRSQALAYKVQGSENPFESAALLESQANGGEARAQAAGIGGGSGNASGRSRAKTLNQEAEAMKRQIEAAVANRSMEQLLDPDQQKNLEGMLQGWADLKRQAIKADGANLSPEEIQDRLASFEVEAADYIAKTLGGSIAMAKKLLAEGKQRHADETATRLTNELAAGEGNLDEALRSINDTITDAAQAAIDAADEEFKAQGANLDPKIAAEAAEKRRKITEDAAKQLIEKTLAAIEAAFEAQTREIDVKYGRLEAKEGAYSNEDGNRRLSDTQRTLSQKRMEEYRRRRAKEELDAARENRDRVEAEVGKADPDGKVPEKLQEANEQVEEAQQNFDILTGKAEEFGSAIEAIRGAWSAWVYQAQVDRPIFEQLADGMVGVFEQARGSLGTMIKDVLSGTKSMSDAFRDFAASVLDSLLEMAAKMIANQIIMWVMGAFMPGTGSMGPGTSAPAHGGNFGFAWHGGLVKARRMAGGGVVPGKIRTRDSVPTMLMPGEFVMSQSAVDMIGADRLAAMNAMGNRRMSQMPSLSAAMPQRQPDTTNVWVVAPEQKPPPSKRDIISVITEDMLKNGQTKKLVKAIAMGAA